MAEGKNDTGVGSPFEYGLPAGNLTAGLVARIPNSRAFVRIRPRCTVGGNIRSQPRRMAHGRRVHGAEVSRILERKVQAAEEVRRVACELQAEGISLTRRNLRPRLTSSDYLNLEEGRTALREVRRQMAPQTRSEYIPHRYSPHLCTPYDRCATASAANACFKGLSLWQSYASQLAKLSFKGQMMSGQTMVQVRPSDASSHNTTGPSPYSVNDKRSKVSVS